MRNYITGRLGYNPRNRRYGLLVMDLWEHNSDRSSGIGRIG